MDIDQEEMDSAEPHGTVIKSELLEKLQETDCFSSSPIAPKVDHRKIKTLCLFLSSLGIVSSLCNESM